MPNLTGERPLEGLTPDSILALHDAGYRAVLGRLGSGRVVDIGCGEGFESAGLAGPERYVIGVDYSFAALKATIGRFPTTTVCPAQMEATNLGLAQGSVKWVCSSHLIEHFANPESHVAEISRVLASDGTAFVLTPNRPADFENPFHLTLFDAADLAELLDEWFWEVRVYGLDATEVVKADFASRRAKAQRLLALDHFDIRHKIPRSWYLAAYTRLLPVAYRFLAKATTAGGSGITAEDFFVTEEVDETTLALFAVASIPKRPKGTYGVKGSGRG